jgi:hypothetical protein
MKLRVYDGARGSKDRHQYEDYIDRYSLYFPHPKKWIDEDYRKFRERITGDFLRFSFSEDGKIINRCTWNEWNIRNGLCDSLGKKVNINTLPKHVQKWIAGYEKVYNEMIKHPEDEKIVEAWNNYF